MSVMNNKGQLPFISLLFSLLVFFIFWIMFFAKWLSDWGEALIVSQSLTGLSAFLVANMNVWVFIGIILGVLGSVYFGGRA